MAIVFLALDCSPTIFHLTLGCSVEQSPEEIALKYLNNCAFAIGMKPVFQFGYYAGTIGEHGANRLPNGLFTHGG